MADTLQSRVAPPRRYQSAWLIALMVAIALILMFVAIGLNGTESPTITDSVSGFEGQPEVIEQTVPAYIQESIVFGERAPSDVTGAAEIMPVYLVEASYFDE